MRYKYTKFTGGDLEGLDLEELLSKLSDLLLSSGFGPCTRRRSIISAIVQGGRNIYLYLRD